MSWRRINLDWPLVLSALALTVFGILMVYSAGKTDVPHRAVAIAYRKQAEWWIVGLIGAYAISRASVRLIEWLTLPVFAFSVALLLALVVGLGSGAGTAASSKSWLTIGTHRLGQPSEFAKLAVVLMLAKVLSDTKQAATSVLDLWRPAIVVAIPAALVLKGHDLGSTLVFVGIFFGMVFWSGVSGRLLLLLASPILSLVLSFNAAIWGAWLFLLLALVIWYRPYVLEGVLLMLTNFVMGVSGPILWEKLSTYQQNRLLVFLDPSFDPQRSGWHVTQSLVAIGSGGWLGQGFTQGPQKRLAFIPEQHTDFIFAVVGEELGFIGVTIALALFCVFFFRVIRIAERANDSFSSLVAFGFLTMWFSHVFENVGMTLSLVPVTGIPLPFFSYGGSFLLASWLAIGVLARVSSEGRGGLTGPFRV